MSGELRIEVGSDYGRFNDDPPAWTIIVSRGGSGFPVNVPIRDRAKAERIADYLRAELADEFEADEAFKAEKYKRLDRELMERHERARPAREAAERARKREAKTAPRVEARECPDCSHLFTEPGEAIYECGRCGQASTERRCDQCHIFAAKLADESCPTCNADITDARTLTAAQLANGELVEVPK